MAQLVQRALLLVLLGAAFGLFFNAVAPKGIPLIAPPKKVPKADAYMPLTRAHELWSTANGFFLDARKPADYEAGHIPQALNVPAESFPEAYQKVAPMLTPDTPIVAYCDGTECELSHHLAEQLRQQGHTNVHMLFNGYTAWKTNGYPVETGPAR